MRLLFSFVFILLGFLILASCAPAPHEYPKIETGRELTFPRDHYAHREFRTEWWYYSGHLDAEDGSSYGFEVVFFVRRTDTDVVLGFPASIYSNPSHLAHFAITDLHKGQFFYDELRTGDYLDKKKDAGALEEDFYVWNRDWSTSIVDGKIHLNAQMKGYDLSLALQSKKPFVLHGDNGYFVKSKGPDFPRGTYYISYTRLVGEGQLQVDGVPKKVKATVWMDHEFGSHQLAPDQLGWDWVSIQFKDGSEMMVYLLKQADGTWGKESKGTYIDAEGKVVHLPFEALQITPVGQWKSPKTDAVYSTKWQIRVLPLDIAIRVNPMIDETEIDSKGSTMVKYWEGPVDVVGTKGGFPIAGRGFMELCGNAHPMKVLSKKDNKFNITGG